MVYVLHGKYWCPFLVVVQYKGTKVKEEIKGCRGLVVVRAGTYIMYVYHAVEHQSRDVTSCM